MSNVDLTGDFPKSLKIYLSGVLFIFILGYLSLVFIEGMSFVDALYFLIVTVSTVGFGDITPTTPFAKIIVSVLIIISISSIALLSEQIVSRMVILNTSKRYDLPSSPLNYENHIIVCGFTKIAENIALLFQGRFFRIIVIDPHKVAVERARNFGLEAYLGKPELKSTLNTLNISDALGLYLFMDDENQNVLTSLQARSLHEDLLIYAATDHELSIELGNLIGIDRTYHYERIVANNIKFSLQEIIAFALPNQLLSPDAMFFQILVSKKFDHENRFDKYYPVGMLDETLTEFIPIEDIDDLDDAFNQNYLLMLTIPRDHVLDHLDDRIMNTPIIGETGDTVNNVVIGGYNPTARHIIHELDPEIIQDYKFKVLTFSEEHAEMARKDGFSVVYCHREELKDRLADFELSSTLLVNLFDRLTDSLMVNTVIRKLNMDVFIVQMAYNRIETEVLTKSGANRILIPEVLMSRGMFLILLSTKNFINSMVWGNAHLFEHIVDKDSPFKGKYVHELNDLDYEVLLYQSSSGNVIEHVDDMIIEKGAHLLLYRNHDILRISDQIIEETHH